MRIKKIELIGFKSFKDRTVIQFDAGITGVVGPNGCGKSNIVDALLWVMGEMSAKDLRGASMSDVIFAGSEDYPAAGMAEVSLTLENDGGPFPAQYLKFSEIMVTRRLHRSGDSEYLINKEPARLRDIQEIFMDTGAGSKGFSIIQQGMIGRIITAKPEDRRMLIEEAAGITKFKARKRESQRKLESTEQNLLRLQDIVGELKRQIESLQRQSQRAERYRNLKKQIEEIELWTCSRQFKNLREVAEQAHSNFQQAEVGQVQSTTQLAELRVHLEEKKLKLLEQEKVLDQHQSALLELQNRIQKKELEVQELKFRIEQVKRDEQMKNVLIREQVARRGLLAQELQSFLSVDQNLKSEIQQLESDYSLQKLTFEETQVRISELDEDLTVLRREFFALGQSEATLSAQVQSLDQQISDVEQKSENEGLVFEELQKKYAEFEQRKNRLTTEQDGEKQLQLSLLNDVETFEANKKSLQTEIYSKKIEVDQFKDQLNQVSSRLYGLENLQQSFEGFDEGVKSVMLWQKKYAQEGQAASAGTLDADGHQVAVHDWFQPVSEAVEVPAEFELAMEAALGSRLQLLLSEDGEKTLKAVDFLKAEKKGRSSFLADSSGVQNAEIASTLSNHSDIAPVYLKDFIQAPERFKNSVHRILSQVAVVENIRHALKLRAENPQWTFVTRDGDVLSSDGVLTAGSNDDMESGVLKRRREMKELSVQKSEWAGKLALAQSSLKKCETQLDHAIAEFESAQKRKIEQEIKLTELRKDLERAENELFNAKNILIRQEKEIHRLREVYEQQKLKRQQLGLHLSETQEKRKQLEETVNDKGMDLQNSKMGFESLQSQVMDLQLRLASKKQKDQNDSQHVASLQKQISGLDQQIEKISTETEKNSTQLSESAMNHEQAKLDFEKIKEAIESGRSVLSHQRSDFDQLSLEVRTLESEVNAGSQKSNALQVQMTDAQIKLEQARMKETYLIEQVRERYMLNLEEIYSQRSEIDGDLEKSEVELKDLKEKVSKIGEVNLSAIEEYQQSNERYEFLLKQQNDLVQAKSQLSKVIDRINKICAKRFKETFELVNDRFKKVFPVLFGGGEAHLELHEDQERGELGIDIIAKPPGKKMQNISLLSGGEKALTAVSLVFSIFLVRPSPYCLLDEVDAPLDDANVFRFNDLVREMAKRSQIIVVTHNKHTMEVAGKLYGVTMQEKGVSTMVSVNLQDL